ncbi:MAG: hypothetical protein AAFS03_11700, partial [Pseudomonadota bacterium]
VRLGMPVVASRIAIDGYGAIDDASIMLADDSADFADHIVALLASGDKRRAQADHAQAAVAVAFAENAQLKAHLTLTIHRKSSAKAGCPPPASRTAG